MFDALLRMQLGPIVERLAEMEVKLEDRHAHPVSGRVMPACHHHRRRGSCSPASPT
jgi:hypothetical protein